MTLDQLEVRKAFIGIFVGDSGCGKSAAVASFAYDGDLKCYDLDHRARGMLGLPWPMELKKRIEIVQDISVDNGFEDLDKALTLDILRVQARNATGAKTYAFESFATLQKMLMYDSMKQRGAFGGNKEGFKGKFRGKLAFPHPDDYNYVSAAIHQLVFKGIHALTGAHVILSAWCVDQYGKPKVGPDGGPANEYARDEVIGKKLLGTNALAAEVPGYFDEVYYFSKEETTGGKAVDYFVEFEGKLAKTARTELKGLGKVKWTDRSFYDIYQALLKGEKLTPLTGEIHPIVKK